MSDLSISAQALGALDVSLNTTAHNIANVSTEGYQPLRTEYGSDYLLKPYPMDELLDIIHIAYDRRKTALGA